MDCDSYNAIIMKNAMSTAPYVPNVGSRSGVMGDFPTLPKVIGNQKIAPIVFTAVNNIQVSSELWSKAVGTPDNDDATTPLSDAVDEKRNIAPT